MSAEQQSMIIKVPEGKICDYIDAEIRNDTPEEYVRQTIEKRLVNEHKYSKEQIRVEFGLKSGSRRHRVDLAVFQKDCSDFSQNSVWLIVECKSEKTEPGNNKDGIDQLHSYMSVCPNCEWGMWTNGKDKKVFRKTKEEGKYKYEEYNDIPPADGSLEEVDRPKPGKLKKAYEDNLLMVFRTCHNHIYATEGMQKDRAFFELLKLIFCKTLDEQEMDKSLKFYATSGECSNPDGQLTAKNRIVEIFNRVKRQYPQIFLENEEIELKPYSLAHIVSELQPYSLLETHVDVKGKAYEELVGANLRGDRGEFFTPRNIMRMAVEMVDPQPEEKVCDTSCGTGGFLVMAMNHVIEQMKSKAEKQLGKAESNWTDSEKAGFKERLIRLASSDFYGFDINPDLVKATKMNMVMNNDGSGNIYRNNSLLPPHEWGSQLKQQLGGNLNIVADNIKNERTIEFFDVIVTNPPFGSKIPIKGEHILGQFDLGHLWRKEQHGGGPAKWIKSSALQTSAPPERLFIERCIQFLKPGGRLAIVLPDSILGNPGLDYVRAWLFNKTRIIASVDLHADTFQPRNGTQTSILILQKKTQNEIISEQEQRRFRPYNIFMAVVEKVGHDKRGNTIFKRDKSGEEIWVSEKSGASQTNQNKDGSVAYYETESRTRIIDDQSKDVPFKFKEWMQKEGFSW